MKGTTYPLLWASAYTTLPAVIVPTSSCLVLLISIMGDVGNELNGSGPKARQWSNLRQPCSFTISVNIRKDWQKRNRSQRFERTPAFDCNGYRKRTDLWSNERTQKNLRLIWKMLSRTPMYREARFSAIECATNKRATHCWSLWWRYKKFGTLQSNDALWSQRVFGRREVNLATYHRYRYPIATTCGHKVNEGLSQWLLPAFGNWDIQIESYVRNPRRMRYDPIHAITGFETSCQKN